MLKQTAIAEKVQYYLHILIYMFLVNHCGSGQLTHDAVEKEEELQRSDKRMIQPASYHEEVMSIRNCTWAPNSYIIVDM